MTTTTTNGNKTEKKGINWNGKFDGNNATIDAKISGDGKTEQFHKTLNKDEINKLFEVPTQNYELDNRLLNDWPTNLDNNMLSLMKTRKFTFII